MQRIRPAVLRLPAALAVALVLGGCGGENGDGLGDTLLAASKPDPLTARRPPGGRENLTAISRPNRTQADMREAPYLFSTTDQVLWDGKPTLEGLWVAHTATVVAQRVRITNPRTGTVIDGALLPRRTAGSRTGMVISAEAADALGMLPGVPAELELVAIEPDTPPLDFASTGDTQVETPRPSASAPPADLRPGDPPASTGAPDRAVPTEIASGGQPGADAAPATGRPPPPGATATGYVPAGVREATATTPEASTASADEGGAEALMPTPDPAPAIVQKTAATPAEPPPDLASTGDIAPPTPSPARTTVAVDATPAVTATSPPYVPRVSEPADQPLAAEPAYVPTATPTGETAAPDIGETATAAGPQRAEPTETYVPDVVRTAAEPDAPATPAGPADATPGAPTADTAIADGKPYIQAGYFAVPEHAADLVRTLFAYGIPARNEATTVRGSSLNRVVAGPFASREARERALRQLRQIGIADARPAAG